MLVSDVPNVPWDFQTKCLVTRRWMKFIAEAAIFGMFIMVLSFLLLLEQLHGALMFEWLIFTCRKRFWNFFFFELQKVGFFYLCQNELFLRSFDKGKEKNFPRFPAYRYSHLKLTEVLQSLNLFFQNSQKSNI